MAESEQQERMMSETIVKEAVGLGMKTPLRESILEAVEEAEGGPSGGGSKLPLAGALFGLGAAVGFLAGRQSPELEETSLEDIQEIQEPEIIEDVVEEGIGATGETTEMASETETEEGGSSRLMQLLMAVGAIAAIAVARRRLGGGEEEEWEPIEEFEPATTDELEESEDEAAEDEEAVETEAGGEDESEE